MPVVQAISEKLAGRLKVLRLNTDDNPSTPTSYEIHGIPTLVLFKGGKEVARHVGYAPLSAIEAKLEPHLS
jgi:thioredoxin 1